MSLTSAPVEIILYILQSCDSFTELRALFSTAAVSTVRATALVHDAHRDGRLPPKIRPEDLTGELRKPSLQELESVFGLHHFVQCVELRYITLKLHEGFANHHDLSRWPLERDSVDLPLIFPEEPEGMPVWRGRFHRAAYTSLLMGAVFARAYNEPFYAPDLDPDLTSSSSTTLDQRAAEDAPQAMSDSHKARGELLNSIRRAVFNRVQGKFHHRENGAHNFYLQKEEIECLRQFPVYDLNDELGGQEKVFGPFIEWFMRSTVAEYRATEPTPASRDPSRPELVMDTETEEHQNNAYWIYPSMAHYEWPEDGTQLTAWFKGGSPAEGEAILWAAMQSIHIFEFILTCISNLDGAWRFGRDSRKNVALFSGQTVTAKVALFGVFQAEEILMPFQIDDSVDQHLLARRPVASTRPSYLFPSPPGVEEDGHAPEDPSGEANPGTELLDIPSFLEELYNYSGMPNVYSGNIRENLPPPPLQLFIFLLQHHFRLQFYKDVFQTYWEDGQDYWNFRNMATIFSNGLELVPNRNPIMCRSGMEFLVPYQKPDYEFDESRWGYTRSEYSWNPRTYEPNTSYFDDL
ncbi:hypothetical protein N0V85_000959 [Neurospora sp. IMI 360204]|nr:hypothetical protein N0V85_000959 [Neurospora sp. IMI 360204]